MFITCKCLNVSIRTRGSNLKDVNDDNIELSPVESSDGFFHEVINDFYTNFDQIKRTRYIWQIFVFHKYCCVFIFLHEFRQIKRTRYIWQIFVFHKYSCVSSLFSILSDLWSFYYSCLIFQKLAMATELEGITKEQSGLIEFKNVGAWICHFCFNCSMYTHAVHREHGAALVLINTNMIVSIVLFFFFFFFIQKTSFDIRQLVFSEIQSFYSKFESENNKK